MKKHRHVGAGLTAGAFFLIGTLAVAQTAPNARGVRPRDAQSGQASGWQDQSNPAASGSRLHPHSNSSNNNKTLGSAHATESMNGAAAPQSTEATQRRSVTIVMTNDAQSVKARSSAHATESLDRPGNSAAQKGTNPLYEDSGKSGTNPMYEGKGQANVKPGTGTTAVEYKDPEDMTTRYRPGNNKTTSSAATQGAGATQQQTGQNNGPDAIARKHVAGVKYENRSAASSTGSTTAPGFAVNEQGSSTATNTGKKRGR